MSKNSVKKVPENEKYGFVYLWYDRKHKRYYVGCHWGTEDDGYVCSSNWMRDAFYRRPLDFKRRIISKIYTNRQDLLEEEYRFLQMIKPEELKIRYYNLTQHHNGHWSTNEEKTLSLKEKISIKTKEAMQRPKVREKYEEGIKTRDTKGSDPEIIEKRRQSMIKTMAEKFPVESRKKRIPVNSPELKELHRKNTQNRWDNMSDEEKLEHNKKVSVGLKNYYQEHEHPAKGRVVSEETKEKMSASQRGKKKPKCSESIKLIWENKSDLERKWSDEQREKYKNAISLQSEQQKQDIRNKKRACSKNKPFVINGKEYFGLRDAVDGLDIPMSTILHRLRSKNFKEYYYK